MASKILANLFNITSTDLKTFQSSEGESIVATGGASAGKGETAEIYSSYGIVSRPGAGTKGLRIRFGKIDIIIGVYNYGITPPENPGDTKIFSTDADGAEKATTKLLADGTMEINGSDDFAVAYTDLSSGLSSQDTDINAELSKLTTTLSAIVTAFAALGVTIPAYTQGTISTDISDSKVDTVKLP